MASRLPRVIKKVPAKESDKRELIMAHAARRRAVVKPMAGVCLVGIVLSVIAVGGGWLMTLRPSLRAVAPVQKDALLQVVRERTAVLMAPTSSSPSLP